MITAGGRAGSPQQTADKTHTMHNTEEDENGDDDDDDDDKTIKTTVVMAMMTVPLQIFQDERRASMQLSLPLDTFLFAGQRT